MSIITRSSLNPINCFYQSFWPIVLPDVCIFITTYCARVWKCLFMCKTSHTLYQIPITSNTANNMLFCLSLAKVRFLCFYLWYFWQPSENDGERPYAYRQKKRYCPQYGWVQPSRPSPRDYDANYAQTIAVNHKTSADCGRNPSDPDSRDRKQTTLKLSVVVLVTRASPQ